MKLIKFSYDKPSVFRSFFYWFWFTKDCPFGTTYGSDRANSFRYCGSDYRLLIRRRFGFTWECAYHRTELDSLIYMLTFLLSVLALTFLLIEIALIVLFKLNLLVCYSN